MNPLAIELNKKIQESSPAVMDCLSEGGKEMFYPAGILSQGAEAKKNAHKFNATIGIAVDNAEPMYVPATRKFFANLETDEIYTYAPPGGRPKLRGLWKERMIDLNPLLKDKSTSTPMVTGGLTHALSIVGDLFVGKDDVVIIPDKLWGVYRLNFVVRKGGEIVNYPLFNEQKGFNTKGLDETLERELKKHKKCVVLLNFPNNPTGYTPIKEEAEEIEQIIKKHAEKGAKLVTVFDDAYFGLFYENAIKNSLFSKMCDIHENVLAVKVDGATKESYAWGFRTGFITFGSKTDKPEDLYHALEMKAQGFIRSVVSSCNHSSQSILEKALQDPEYHTSIEANYKIIEKRVIRLKQILENAKYQEDWDYYPFNSGYFMCLKLHNVEAERVRVHLLDKYGIGTIMTGEYDLRIAFSCVDEKNIEELVDLTHQAVKDLTD